MKYTKEIFTAYLSLAKMSEKAHGDGVCVFSLNAFFSVSVLNLLTCSLAHLLTSGLPFTAQFSEEVFLLQPTGEHAVAENLTVLLLGSTSCLELLAANISTV